MTAADIAARLGITDRTVRRHLATPPRRARTRGGLTKENRMKNRRNAIAIVVVWVIRPRRGSCPVHRTIGPHQTMDHRRPPADPGQATTRTPAPA